MAVRGGALRASCWGGGGARLPLRVGAAAAGAAVGDAKKFLQLEQPLHLHHEPAKHAEPQSIEVDRYTGQWAGAMRTMRVACLAPTDALRRRRVVCVLGGARGRGERASVVEG